MTEVELVKRTLHAIVQANRGGVSLSRLQSDYKELTGDQIPHQEMGHVQVEALLASTSSVRMERGGSGEASVATMWYSERNVWQIKYAN